MRDGWFNHLLEMVDSTISEMVDGLQGMRQIQVDCWTIRGQGETEK